MKPEELKREEQEETNGGSLLGNDSTSDSGIAGSLGIDNLASFNSTSQDGDESSSSSTSLGNGINLDGLGRSNKSTD